MKKTHHAFVVTATLLLGGCTETTFTVPKTPNPVLLGPVDRVGGGAPLPTTNVGDVSGQSENFATTSTSTERHGNVVVRTTDVSWRQVTSGPFVASLLAKTDGRDECSVRIRQIKSGAYFFFLGGAAITNQWINVNGDVMEVGHAAK